MTSARRPAVPRSPADLAAAVPHRRRRVPRRAVAAGPHRRRPHHPLGGADHPARLPPGRDPPPGRAGLTRLRRGPGHRRRGQPALMPRGQAAVLTPSRLVIARKRRGLTLTQLAGLTGLSTRSISLYENGHQEPVRGHAAPAGRGTRRVPRVPRRAGRGRDPRGGGELPGAEQDDRPAAGPGAERGPGRAADQRLDRRQVPAAGHRHPGPAPATIPRPPPRWSGPTGGWASARSATCCTCSNPAGPGSTR